MKKFYVYIDYTKEEIPRPFYVGKGRGNRINHIKRNYLHTKIISQFGIERCKVFESDNETEVLQKEIDLIKFYKTYIHDKNASEIACNITFGGEGTSGCHVRSVAKYNINDLINPIQIYSSKEIAAEENNISLYDLHLCLSRTLDKVINNFYWSWYAPKKTKQQPKDINCTIVLQFDKNGILIKEFSSIRELKIIFDVPTISSIIRSKDKEKMLRKFNCYFEFKDASKYNKHNSRANEAKLVVGEKLTNRIIGEETKQKLSISRSKPIFVYDKNLTLIYEFDSVKLAAKFFNINKNILLNSLHCCDGKFKEYILKFKFEFDNKPQGFIMSEDACKKISISRSKFSIKQYDLEHNFIDEYHNFTNVMRAHILLIDFIRKIHNLIRLPRNGEEHLYCGYYWRITLKDA